jgi:hypothetical protein
MKVPVHFATDFRRANEQRVRIALKRTCAGFGRDFFGVAEQCQARAVVTDGQIVPRCGIDF